MNANTVTVSTLQDTICRTIEKFPKERARIERAATLVALGHVTQVAPDAFEVVSQSDSAVFYTVKAADFTALATCPCIDSQRHPEQPCKHEWAVSLVLVAEERQRRLNARATEQARRAVETADSVALAYARATGFAA